MLTSWLESLLPGTRSLRVPLISGLLWTFFVWLLVADAIPSRGEADGWVRQVYDLAEAGGLLLTGIVATILIFVLGATVTSATEWIASVIGGAGVWLRRQWDWQTHARRSRLRLEARVAEAKDQLDTAQAADKGATDEERKKRDQRLADRRRQHAELEKRLGVVDRNSRVRNWYVRNREEARGVLGSPPTTTDNNVELEIIQQVRRRELEKTLQERDLDTTVEEVEQKTSRASSPDYGTATRLAQEFKADPLDPLRALDDDKVLELDRERAEREVRLVVSLPIVALGIYAAVTWDAWWSLLAVVGASSLIGNSLARSSERAKVLNFIRVRSLHGLETPALAEAAVRGRDSVRSYAAQLRTAQDMHDRESAA